VDEEQARRASRAEAAAASTREEAYETRHFARFNYNQIPVLFHSHQVRLSQVHAAGRSPQGRREQEIEPETAIEVRGATHVNKIKWRDGRRVEVTISLYT
jgi:hypothetical protein